MSSEDLTINNLVLSKDNLYNFRRPRDDITSYFVKHIGFKYDFFLMNGILILKKEEKR